MEEVKLGDKTYKLKPYHGSRKASLGNSVCDCPKVYRVLGYFCVCMMRIYCPNCGLRCFGTHD